MSTPGCCAVNNKNEPCGQGGNLTYYNQQNWKLCEAIIVLLIFPSRISRFIRPFSCSLTEACRLCNVTSQTDLGRPTTEDFLKYLPNFLTRNPDVNCAKAGHAAYGKVTPDRNNLYIGVDVLTMYTTEFRRGKYTFLFQAVRYSDTDIGPFHFMAYHSLLKTSKDYYSALKEARVLADNMTAMLRSKTNTDAKVFPYR